ncbi:hypothetical protein [Flavobacterium sp. FlaQc-50]|uniref:hypothetical protein n=1 Tax=unclassified Flavobacterium TaxID=196869 RepID=UPI003756D6F8
MAKINNKLIYALENLPSLLDYLIGSKDINGKTKNFSLQSIINLINGVNGVNVIQYQFFSEPTPDVDFTTPGAMFTNNNETNVNNFSSLIFNKRTLGNYDLTVLFEFLIDLDNLYLGVANPSDPNNFFTFKVTSIDDQGDYFIFEVEPYNDLYIGEFADELVYSIYWETKEWMSEITDIEAELDTKLNHGGYSGTGQDLKNEIDAVVTDLDTNYYTKPEVDSKVSSVYKYKGNVNTYADLPTSGRVVGDVWNALDTDINWAWTGTVWDNLGGMFDVSGKEDKTNKQNSLVPDGTGQKYLTVDAAIVGLNGKLDKGTYTGNAGDLKTDIDNIFQPDTLISAVPPTRVVNTFTYPAAQYQALISKTIRTNPAQLVTTIDVATTDYKRVDLIYFRSDNVLVKLVGTESLTVAQRPDIPVGTIGVPVSFINVFGNVVSDPTPIDKEISIQDIFGTERFKIKDYVRFEGVSFNPTQKLLSIDPLVPLSAFLDITNGNDVTAVIENSKKPFKTIEKLLSSLPVTTGETYTIYITGGTVPVRRKILVRNLRFVAYKPVTLDFTNCMESDGVTHVTQVFDLTGGIASFWYFDNKNISILCTYVGNKEFNGTLISLIGYINTLEWRSRTTQTFFSSCVARPGSIIEFGTIYDTAQLTQGFAIPGVANVTVNTYICNNSQTLVGPSLAGSFMEIKNIVGNSAGTSAGTSSLGYLKIGNISSATNFLPFCVKVEFYGSINSTCVINLSNTARITGTLDTVLFAVATNVATKRTFESFNGKINDIQIIKGGSLEFINSNVTVSTNLFKKYVGANVAAQVTDPNLLFLKGSNNFTQEITTNDLITYEGVTNPDRSVIIHDYGLAVTNATSFGTYCKYIKESLSFKEKSKEVVIRSKKDLLNRTLDSLTTYIIDGSIILLTGEFIEVPSGGLTIVGYGFNASSISKNVAGQSIFSSPAGNSGYFVTRDISYMPGVGTVFNLTDSTGTHAIELNDVNFQGVTGSSLGTLSGYRQFTGTTCGLYGLSDGLILEGNWSGFKLTNSNVIGFGGAGTLFKKGTATVFSNRFYIDLNLQVATGSKICDFAPANFTNDKSLQVVNCYAKVNGVIDATTTSVTFPNITETSSKAYFVNNIGIKNSNITPFGISTANLLTYANDAAAAAGGIVQIGETYIESVTGYHKTRLT